MGWGIDFNTDIYLSRQDYHENISEVEDAISDKEENITTIKTQINMFASASPESLIPDEWNGEPIRWINQEVDNLIDQLHEEIVDKYQLELYLEYLKNKQNE